jgi:hypothetical protein
VNNELKCIWKKAAMTQCLVLFRHVPGETEENHKKYEVRRVDLRLTFELGIFGTRTTNPYTSI